MSSSRGDGSVYQRADGRWCAAFTDPKTGKRRTRYAATENAARELLRDMRTRVGAGVIATDARTTLAAYTADWLDNRAGKRRSPATVREYRWRLEKHVLPTLGGQRIGAITVVDVEDLLDDLAAAGLSHSTLLGVRNALAAVLTDAIRRRQLREGNVATMAQMPENVERQAPVAAPTVAQVRALLAATSGTELGRILTVLAATGARVGEVLAATWDTLDLDNGAWLVAATVTRDLDGSTVIGPRTKTGRSRRVHLSPAAVAALRAQRAHVAEARLAAGRLWTDHGLCFPTTVGTPMDARNLRKDLRPVAARAGFVGSFHQLRHFVASVSVGTAGVEVTAKVLGHARVATTVDTYGHLVDSDAAAVSSAVSRVLG